MLATASPAPHGVFSAADLCRSMRTPAAGSVAWSSGLDRVLRHDVEHGLLEVQAGVPWAALTGIPGAGSLPGTVGHGVAQNRPGPDGRPLVAHVRSLTLATADGQLRRASREREPDLFRLAVGGLGAFGPLYSVTLDVASLAGAHAASVDPVQVPLPSTELAGPRHALELLLPPGAAEAVATRLREAIAERRCALERMEARPALPEDVTLLRWARRDYVALLVEFRVRPTLGASVAAAQLRGRLMDLSIAAGGSFMPVSLPDATRAQADACYPMLGEFLGEKRRLDPQDRIGSAWTRGATRVWRDARCQVRFSKS